MGRIQWSDLSVGVRTQVESIVQQYLNAHGGTAPSTGGGGAAGSGTVTMRGVWDPTQDYRAGDLVTLGDNGGAFLFTADVPATPDGPTTEQALVLLAATSVYDQIVAYPRMTYMGPWGFNIDYPQQSVVTYQGALFVAQLGEIPANQPPDPGSTWQKLAEGAPTS